MGRTVTAVVGVVAAVAIAVVAPYLGGIVAGLVFGAGATSVAIAFTTAVIGLTLAAGAALAFRALGVGAPKAKLATSPPYPQGTAVVGGAFGLQAPRFALEPTMPPVRLNPLVRFWQYGFARFYIVELVGD